MTGNAAKPDFTRVVRQAAAHLQAAGRTVVCDRATARAARLKLPVCRNLAGLAEKVDLLMVLGGDGTMLRVAREVAGSPTPLLGINIGGLGFLTAVTADALDASLQHLWQGHFTLETRCLIETELRRGRRSQRLLALNDFVVSRSHAARLIELQVEVDGAELTRYRCDGLIVSSPTGSTAYSLAAGGALICPTADVFSLTPICPHTLSNRAVIVALDSTIRVTATEPGQPTLLCADGQVMRDFGPGDVATFRRSPRTIRLLHLPGASFFETLRRKLQWRGTSV